MSSIVTGYEYDIFISYRHNDDRTGWVTEFVKSLQHEVAATLKEPVSFYYDTNPKDGIIETHEVKDSLKEKVKCLIFIPIISQTYCDPKSFAWQNEFIAFRDFAESDSYGLQIRLASGNVAKRILPVRIHEIDPSDVKLYEQVTGGIMRPIDFVFKSAGVNRPLRPQDDEAREITHDLFYRDQLNKVANAVKELITAFKDGSEAVVMQPATHIDNKDRAPSSTPSKNARFKINRNASISILLVLLSLIAAFYFLNPKTISTSEDKKSTKSIAVLSFVDMSPNKDQEYFSDGISEELINALIKIPGMKVSGRTSSFSYKGTNVNLQEIGRALGVETILEGSIRKAGNKVRITAQFDYAPRGLSKSSIP